MVFNYIMIQIIGHMRKDHLCFLLFFLLGLDTEVFVKLLSYKNPPVFSTCTGFFWLVSIGKEFDPYFPWILNPNIDGEKWD